MKYNPALLRQSDNPCPVGRDLLNAGAVVVTGGRWQSQIASFSTLAQMWPGTDLILKDRILRNGDSGFRSPPKLVTYSRQVRVAGTTSQVARGKVMEGVWMEMMTA